MTSPTKVIHFSTEFWLVMLLLFHSTLNVAYWRPRPPPTPLSSTTATNMTICLLTYICSVNNANKHHCGWHLLRHQQQGQQLLQSSNMVISSNNKHQWTTTTTIPVYQAERSTQQKKKLAEKEKRMEQMDRQRRSSSTYCEHSKFTPVW